MEKIEALNQRLIDYYGLDTSTGQAMFRIVFANYESEQRLVYETESGVELLFPMVMEVKKYPYLKDMYVLERLVAVPDEQKKDLPARNCLMSQCGHTEVMIISHYILFGRLRSSLWTALYAALGKKSMRKYVDDEKNTTEEGRQQRIAELHAELFENETPTGDALRYKEGIVVPRNYEKGE